MALFSIYWLQCFLWIETDCPICNFFYHQMNGSLHLPVRCLFLQLLSVFLEVSMTSRLSMRHCLLQKCGEFIPITVGSLGEQNSAGVGTYLLSSDANLTDSASQSKVGGVSKFPLSEIQNHEVRGVRSHANKLISPPVASYRRNCTWEKECRYLLPCMPNFQALTYTNVLRSNGNQLFTFQFSA